MRGYCALKECGRGYMFQVGWNKYHDLEEIGDKWPDGMNRVYMDRYWLFRSDLLGLILGIS
jgi:hypothetical protein